MDKMLVWEIEFELDLVKIIIYQHFKNCLKKYQK